MVRKTEETIKKELDIKLRRFIIRNIQQGVPTSKILEAVLKGKYTNKEDIQR